MTDIIIAGAGIGGLCAGLALARRGYDVQIVERSPVLSEVGAGLQLSPNAVKVLRALGVGDLIDASATRPPVLQMRRGRTGAEVFSIPMGDHAVRRYGAPYLHIHRADLIEVLRIAAVSAGVRLRLGARVSVYVREGSEFRVGLDNGDVLGADVLIGADGVRSTIRRQMLGDDNPHYTGCVAWRALAPANVLPDVPEGASVWTGAGRHAVTYRIRGGSLVNFVGVVESGDWREESWADAGDPAELARLYHGWASPVVNTIAAVTSCHRWALFDRDPLVKWSVGRVGLLGDACHPMPPFQAQGAAMAIEDAFVLARCLEQAGDQIAAGLQRYEAIRKPRASRVLASARNNMGVFHRSNPLTQAATYGPMKVANTLLPAVVHARQDWLYGHDVTKG
jgi:salicylate hydroxylase